jgi:autotransporter-associated beta strand protein
MNPNYRNQLLSLATITLVGALPASAATFYWDGVGSQSWSTAGNWSTNSTAVTPNPSNAPGALDDAIFNISTANTAISMNLAANQAAKSLTFRSTGNFTVSSNSSANAGNKTLTIGADGITKTATSGIVSFNGSLRASDSTLGRVDVIVGTSQTWTNNNSATAINLGTNVLNPLLPTPASNVSAATLALGGNTLTLAGDGNFNFGNALATTSVISGTSASSLIKTGAGTLTINSANTFAGVTTISGGKLALSGAGAIASSSRININASTTLDVAGLTANFTLGSAQTVRGSGIILATGKTVIANGTLAPGNSPGTLTQSEGTLQLGVGGDYNWEVYDASGVAGVGYDTVSLTNGATLDLSQLSAVNTYNINLSSLSGLAPDASGDAVNFDNAVSQAWTLFSTGSAITGFSTEKFTINTGAFNGTNGFTNALNGGFFSLALSEDNTDFVLKYTAVPEPSAIFLSSLGMLAVLRRRRSSY